LEILKIIISTSKLQIGPHISSEVVNLLFSVAEIGAKMEETNILHYCAMSSIEVLTEIMLKKYVPPPLKNGNQAVNSVDVLLDIIVKSISLLKLFR
jgi:hypothetical protein